MGFFGDFKAINKVVAKKSLSSYIHNLLLIPALALYVLAMQIFNVIVGISIGALGSPGQFIAGLMSWMFSCFVMSDYLSHIDDVIVSRKFRLNQIGKHYMAYFLPLLAATAIPNIIIYVFYRLTGIGISSMLVMVVYALLATPEVVYQKEIDRLDIFIYGFNYLKENWQQWIPLNVIFGTLILVFYTVTMNHVGWPLINQLWLKTHISMTYLNVLVYVVTWLILGVPFVLVMIYRGYLFKILSVSSRRKREYMRNIYGK